MYALLLTQNPDESAVLALALRRAGLAVTTEQDLARALHIWPDRPADLILLALEGSDPLADARRVRAETDMLLVIVTDPVPERTHYDLLEAGADLVVTRPFSARLLTAQVRALLRRAGNLPVVGLTTLSLAGLTLDPATRTVQVLDQLPRRLTHLEFRLLHTLMTHSDQVLPADTIVERVWGYSGQGDRDLVRGLVSRLRAKVEPDLQNPRYIVTVAGVGYSFSTA
ncbi:MAG: response regulator transcription factor [Chloroflexi bacterium]|nr:response regulator transcription factor [Chloroflexota bacterium]